MAELGRIVARAFTCPAKSSSQCTKCPKAPRKATKPKCLKGKKDKKGWKRSEGTQDTRESEDEQQYNILEARVVIDVDSMVWGLWKAGEDLNSPGLSMCSVMAVYDKSKFAMAHIPPARGANGQLFATGTEVIHESKEKMTANSGVASKERPRGYLLMSTYLYDKRELMRQWFRDNNVQLVERIYDPKDIVPGSGNFVLSSEYNAWPPSVSFMRAVALVQIVSPTEEEIRDLLVGVLQGLSLPH